MYRLVFDVDGGGLAVFSVILFVVAGQPETAIKRANEKLKERLAKGVTFGLVKMRLATGEEFQNARFLVA